MRVGPWGCKHILCVHHYLISMAEQTILIMNWQKADGGGVNWHFKHVVLH